MDASSGTPETTAGTPPGAGAGAGAGAGGGRGLGAYVLRPRELRPGWLALFAGTFFLQLFCATFRAWAIADPILWLAFKLTGQSTAPVHDLAWLIGYGPLIVSLATLILPLGGWWWEQREGARSPSERERLVLEDAMATLKHHDQKLRPPRRWAVLDEHYLNAAVYADTLLVTRGLLESGYLEAVLAHELGHLNTSDGRLTAALYRMTTPPRKEVRRGLRTIALLATGGAVVWLTRAPWGVYWRAREHQADEYAARLGQARSLARFLETNALDYDLPVPFVWLTDASHPPVEHRIDHLSHEQNPF